MSNYGKVVWEEGMLLTPHHFQQWDNYYDDLLAARLRPLASHGWGVLDLQIDQDKVLNGTFRVVSCRAVMPDGLMVNVSSGNDPEPQSRSIEGRLRLAEDKLDVYLAIPDKRPGEANFESNGGGRNQTVRFQHKIVPVPDEMKSGDSKQELVFARGNFQIIFAEELSRGGYVSMKIAELRRTAAGRLGVTEEYVPPALDIAVSPWLVETLRKIIEKLISKSTELSEKMRRTQAGVYDLNASNVGISLLLHTVNSAIPMLVHLQATRMVHPERLYIELAKLLGALMTFVPNRHPKNIVEYDHEDLFSTFSKLAGELTELLKIVIPDKCVPIPLELDRPGIYVGEIPDSGLLAEAAFYLGVLAEKKDVGWLIDVVTKQIVIAADKELDDVMAASADRKLGVPLGHVSQTPASIPADERFQYFKLERQSSYWEGISQMRRIAVYVPDEITKAMPELYAIKP